MLFYIEENLDCMSCSAIVGGFPYIYKRDVCQLEIMLKKDLEEESQGYINFRNGVLSLKDLKLLPHSPSFSFKNTLEVDYEPEVYPSEELKRLLYFLVDSDRFSLEILRATIRKALEPSFAFQTGIWVYGPPGSGKSTVLQWVKNLLGKMAVEMSCDNLNAFGRSHLRGKSLIVISDGESINPFVARVLKQILGRDPITFDRKGENVIEGSFRSNAVVIVTSNLTMGQSLVNAHDPAMFDRFFPVCFPNVPRVPQAGLSKFLLDNTSALVNWSFHTSKLSLQLGVRVGNLAAQAYSDDVFVDFITFHLVSDPEGFLSSVDLLALLDVHFKENGLTPISGKFRRNASSIIGGLLSSIFKLKINAKARKRSIRGLGGVRKLDSDSDKTLELRWDIEKPNFDPFECIRVVPYSEVTDVFDTNSLEKRLERETSK